MPENNPFGYLLQTPEIVNALRRAEFEKQSEGQDFWSQAAGRQGLSAREAMIASGRGLNPEDIRALKTQEILGRSQKSLAEAVQSGMDPLRAQETAISGAMREFMAAGDYQAAQGLIPHLNTVRTYLDEQAKLQAETFNQNTSGAKNATDAAIAAAKAPFEQAKLRREAGFELGQGESRFDENGKLIASVAPKPEKDDSAPTPARVQS